ncbi:hypothetical protein, partial [Thiolapillus sp.]|uniref:hypothetical protein n=1 Tax=Thiolapillus sp. TaxID=2017437 RepID=UPI003AF44CCD
MTRTAGAPIGCQRLSRFWGLGCPKIYHEAEDTLDFGTQTIWYWQCQRTCVNFSKQLIVISPKLIQLWGQLSFG